MRIIGWNPLSLAAAYRQVEISRTMVKYGIILLAGTQLRQGEDSPITKCQLDEHLAINAGWKRGGKFTNKAAGVSVWIGNGITEAEIKLIETPPPDLGGRGMAVRIKTRQFDVTALVLYHPPKTTTPRDMPR